MKELGLLVLVLWFGITHAQNPFEEYNYNPRISTLSGGEFIEDFDNDSIVHIGSVMLNVKNNTITSFIEESITFTEAGAEPTVMSRWFQPDPLSDQFVDWSPYNFVYDNPLMYVDPDGRAAIDIRVWGENESGEEVLIANLISKEVDKDVQTDIVVPDVVGDIIKGHDPITNKTHETESGAIIETNIDPIIGNLLNKMPNEGATPIISFGLEAIFGKGNTSSIDVALFAENGNLDAVGVFGTSGSSYGLALGGGVYTGYLESNTGQSLMIQDIMGESTIYSIGIPNIPFGGGMSIESSSYTGNLLNISGVGGGISRTNAVTRMFGGWGNLKNHSNEK